MVTCSIWELFCWAFPMVYTRKYWMCEANNLETGWVGNRLYQPSLEEVIQGSLTQETPVTYYAKEMRYPAEGDLRLSLMFWLTKRILNSIQRLWKLILRRGCCVQFLEIYISMTVWLAAFHFLKYWICCKNCLKRWEVPEINWSVLAAIRYR